MANHHHVIECLARFVTRMRDRVSDETCVARIERYLEQSALCGVEGRPTALATGDRAISCAVAEMEPLTRAILIVIVARKMSVREVSRRFGMSEERVCRHFRSAVEIVARRREIGALHLC